MKVDDEHFKRMQKLAKVGSWQIDLNTGNVAGSDTALELYGISGESFNLGFIKDVPLPEYREKLDRELENLISGSSDYDIEFLIRRKNDGEIRYIHSIAECDPNKRIVTGIIRDITEQRMIEQRLTESEDRYRSLFDNSISGIIYATVDGKILEANKTMLDLLGSPSLKATMQINLLAFPMLVEAGFSADFSRTVESGECVSNCIHYTSKWGSTCCLEYYLTPIKRKGIVTGVMGKVEDITDRKQAENKIETLLTEKDLILREVHHRIKNNMASIESLLKIQLERSSEENVRLQLKDAVGRLSSMRVLYEKLYQSEDFMQTSIDAYISRLVDEITEIFPESENIRVEKALQSFSIPSDVIFPLGIIINELLTNTLKYAFTEKATEKLILIATRKTGRSVNIMVRDNGTGFPDQSQKGSGGFGLKLIRMLSEQIGAVPNFYNDGGAVFSIDFEITE